MRGRPDPRNVRDHLLEAGYDRRQVERMLRAGSDQGRLDEVNRRIAAAALLRIVAGELGDCEGCGGRGGIELFSSVNPPEECPDCGGSGLVIANADTEALEAVDRMKGDHVELRDRGMGERPENRPECPICGNTREHVHNFD